MMYSGSKKNRRYTKGMTMVETLVYLFVLVLLTSVVVTALVSLIQSYRSIKAAYTIESSISSALERITREIKGASSSSVPGSLVLTTTDGGGSPATVEFSLESQRIHIKLNGVDQGPITAQSARVTSLVFTRIVTARSEAIKLDITIESGQGSGYQTKVFHATAVLRGSYSS